MPRLIDADGLNVYKAWVEVRTDDDTVIYSGKRKIVFADDIANAPTVDAEPVVRCDGCIYRDGQTPGQPNILCWQMHSDDYCSYGTKREVGTYCENIVSVVRCKDCRFHEHEEVGMVWCPNVVGSWMAEDGFCSMGEKREDETN